MYAHMVQRSIPGWFLHFPIRISNIRQAEGNVFNVSDSIGALARLIEC